MYRLREKPGIRTWHARLLWSAPVDRISCRQGQVAAPEAGGIRAGRSLRWWAGAGPPAFQERFEIRVLDPYYTTNPDSRQRAADDGAALVYHGTRLAESVSSQRQARVVRVAPDGAGGTVATPQTLRLLPYGAEGVAGNATQEPRGVSEMRALRSGRHRGD